MDKVAKNVRENVRERSEKMSKNKINYFTINLFGDNWNIYKISSTDNVTLDDKNAEAEIDFESLEIHFKIVKLNSCLHEIWHLYKHYTYTENSNLDNNQEEELSATLFERKGAEMIENAKIIYAKLKDIS